MSVSAPRRPNDHVVNRSHADAEALGERWQRVAALVRYVFRSDDGDRGSRQSRITCALATGGPLLLNHVRAVVGVGAFNQMRWIYANRSIACVHGQVAIANRSTEFAREYEAIAVPLSFAVPNRRIAKLQGTARPVAAAVRPVNGAALNVPPQVIAWGAVLSQVGQLATAPRALVARVAESTRIMCSVRMTRWGAAGARAHSVIVLQPHPKVAG